MGLLALSFSSSLLSSSLMFALDSSGQSASRSALWLASWVWALCYPSTRRLRMLLLRVLKRTLKQLSPGLLSTHPHLNSGCSTCTHNARMARAEICSKFNGNVFGVIQLV